MHFPVSAVARDADHLDLFTTGLDGLIYSTYWDSTSGWATWFPLPGALTDVMRPGAQGGHA